MDHDESSSDREEEAERDSAIPIESRDFLREADERRPPKAPPRQRTSQETNEWLAELPQSAGTPTLAALVQRRRSRFESDAPQAHSVPSELRFERAFEPADFDAPLAGEPMTASLGSETSTADPRRAGRASTILIAIAAAGVAFVAGLSVRRTAPAVSNMEGSSHRLAELTPNIQAAKPAVTPPDFAIEPAAPELSPSSIPLTEPPKSAALHSTSTNADVARRAPEAAVVENPAAVASSASRGTSAATDASESGSAPAPGMAVQAAAHEEGGEVQAAASAATAAEAQPAAAAFDAKTAQLAIGAAAARAAACKRADDPSGIAVVTITFAPSGRATTANVTGEPFAGTATGGCIAGAMRAARVPAFSGEYVTVKKSVSLD